MDLRISVLLFSSSNGTYSLQNQVIFFSMCITACFPYNTDSCVEVTSVNFDSKKSTKITFSADKIYYNFFSGVFKKYKYVNSPQT